MTAWFLVSLYFSNFRILLSFLQESSVSVSYDSLAQSQSWTSGWTYLYHW